MVVIIATFEQFFPRKAVAMGVTILEYECAFQKQTADGCPPRCGSLLLNGLNAIAKSLPSGLGANIQSPRNGIELSDDENDLFQCLLGQHSGVRGPPPNGMAL